MTYKSKITILDLNAYACTGRFLVAVGRYPLILSALSLLTMPITEYFWTWDHIFQTGRDFEIGTFMTLTFLCLVLVLSTHLKHCIESFLCVRRILQFQLTEASIRPTISLSLENSVFKPWSSASQRIGTHGFPLQI